MGAKLSEFYDQVASEFGMTGRMKLAMLTKFSSEKAKAEADSTENITLFQQAISQIRQQKGK